MKLIILPPVKWFLLHLSSFLLQHVGCRGRRLQRRGQPDAAGRGGGCGGGRQRQQPDAAVVAREAEAEVAGDGAGVGGLAAAAARAPEEGLGRDPGRPPQVSRELPQH